MRMVEIKLPVRWVLISTLLVFAVVWIDVLCHIPGGVDNVIGMARRITYGALFAVGFWSASVVLRKWMSQPVRPAVPTLPPAPPLPTYAVPPVQTGPGQYRVRGVDRDTHFETTEIIFADSPDNAQLKVELKGVEVAEVERAG